MRGEVIMINDEFKKLIIELQEELDFTSYLTFGVNIQGLLFCQIGDVYDDFHYKFVFLEEDESYESFSDRIMDAMRGLANGQD
jgi:hypothetical protein